MKLPCHSTQTVSEDSGFTMIEIAIAVAVIAFALVAIVGLLPLGMETQRDNRQETIINHDGTYLLEAIRGGAPNIVDLFNFVDVNSVSANGVTLTITNSADFIRALSTISALNSSNVAIMSSITGAASLRDPAVKDFAMRYKVETRILPASTLKSVDAAIPYASDLAQNLYEIRLALYWPVNLKGELVDGARRQVFRTVVSGRVDPDGFLNTSLFVKP
jgi:prepilin-type N-terminal cleavage/methylation domain-containing protein